MIKIYPDKNGKLLIMRGNQEIGTVEPTEVGLKITSDYLNNNKAMIDLKEPFSLEIQFDDEPIPKD